jgi:uncharacterized membrane protein YebE (DUF533 family)
MINGRKLLDAMVTASASRRPSEASEETHRGFLQDALSAFGSGGQTGNVGQGLGQMIGQVFGQASGGLADLARRPEARQAMGGFSIEDLARRAQEMLGRNPDLAKAALASTAGLMLGTRRGRGLAANLAGLGGLALIGGLAYRAYRNHQAGQPVFGGSDSPELAPNAPNLDPSAVSEEDALLLVRAMVAAATSDGHVDDAERERITAGVGRAGVEREDLDWLNRELANPARIEDLASAATTPEQAAQLYAAARLAIEPDTPQERDFLQRLADALKLDAALKSEIDTGASELKVGT